MHIKPVITAAFLGLLISVKLVAQAGDSLSARRVAPKDTSAFIVYMSNYINLKFSHQSDVDELSVLTEYNDYFLSPNATSVSRLYINYRFISFSIAYVPKWLPGNDDDELKGKTKSGGFGLNLNFNHWLQDISYSKTKGYYLENTAEYITGWKDGDPYVQFPNLEFKNFQGATAYKFNPRYSLNAAATQTERQVKSAGSFIPGLLYRYYIIDDKTPQTGTNTTQKSNNFEIILGAGYYHSFVLKHNFYLSLGATPGAGLVFTKLTTRFPAGDEVSNQQNGMFRIDARAGAGYNGKRFFAGVYSKLTASSFSQQNTSVINQDTRLSIQGFMGYRLNAPSWLRQNTDKVEKMLPL